MIYFTPVNETLFCEERILNVETAKHFGSKLRKTLAALLATMALMAVLLPGALAVDLNVDVGFYFKQSRAGTCTLASAA